MGITRVPFGRWIDPAVAWHALLASEPMSFWLDSGTSGTSYLGAGSGIRSDLPTVPLSGDGDGFEQGGSAGSRTGTGR